MPEPFKIGLIGTGGISRAHLPVYEQFPEKVKLTAVCDIIEEAAKERARDANVDAIYTDYQKMLEEADIDAVDICTGHDTHAPIVIAAAEAGKHALVEKPMGNSMQECRDMIAAADKAGVTLMVAHMLRFSPSTEAVRQLLAGWGARSDPGGAHRHHDERRRETARGALDARWQCRRRYRHDQHDSRSGSGEAPRRRCEESQRGHEDSLSPTEERCRRHSLRHARV